MARPRPRIIGRRPLKNSRALVRRASVLDLPFRTG